MVTNCATEWAGWQQWFSGELGEEFSQEPLFSALSPACLAPRSPLPSVPEKVFPNNLLARLFSEILSKLAWEIQPLTLAI